MNISWQSVIGSISNYVLLCLHTIFYFLWVTLNSILAFLLVILAPIVHLATYIAYGVMLPIHFLGKFETLYIYFGVAALIGLLTGSTLHFASGAFKKVLNLQPLPEQAGRTAASVRIAREKKRLEDVLQTSIPTQRNQGRISTEDTTKDYSEFIEKDRGKRIEGQGLLSQTILEEDDDSEDGF